MLNTWVSLFQPSKTESALLVVFLPSVDREEMVSFDQDFWVEEALRVLGNCFGGAVAFPQGRGVWKDDENAGTLVWDAPVIVHCYTNESAAVQHAATLVAFLRRLGKETNQGAVGFVFQNQYFEIKAPF